MEDQRPSCGQGSASQCLSFVFETGMRSASDLFKPSLNAFASEKLLIHSRISKCFICVWKFSEKIVITKAVKRCLLCFSYCIMVVKGSNLVI